VNTDPNFYKKKKFNYFLKVPSAGVPFFITFYGVIT
jgi:hypothetical protein